jgi:hypothetical protein
MNKEKYKKGEEERNTEQEQQGEVREGRRQKHIPPTVECQRLVESATHFVE